MCDSLLGFIYFFLYTLKRNKNKFEGKGLSTKIVFYDLLSKENCGKIRKNHKKNFNQEIKDKGNSYLKIKPHAQCRTYLELICFLLSAL